LFGGPQLHTRHCYNMLLNINMYSQLLYDSMELTILLYKIRGYGEQNNYYK